MIRYAIPKPEPLVTELDELRGGRAGRARRRRSSRSRRGWPRSASPRRCATRRATGDSIGMRADEDRRRRTRQDRPAARGAVRRPGAPASSARTSTSASSQAVRDGRRRRSPARPTSPSGWREVVGSGRAGGDHRHRGGGVGERRRRRRRAALRRRRRARPDFSRDRRGHGGHRGRPAPGHAGLLRDDAAGRHHPQPARAAAGGRQRAARGDRPVRRLQPGAGARRAASSPTSPATPSSSAGWTRRAPGAASRSTRRRCDFDERPDLARPNGVWDLGSAEAAELAKLAETTYRDVNIGLANQFALYADRIGVDVHADHRGLQLPAVQPPPQPRHRGRRPLHPRLPVVLPVRATPTRRSCAPRARPTARCPSAPSQRLAEAYGDLDRRDGRGARAPATGAGSRRPRSPACSPPSRRCAPGARRRSCTTRCSAPTSSRRWGSSRTAGRARRRRRAAGRPRGVPRASRRPTCPGSGWCSTAAACSTRRGGRASPSSASAAATCRPPRA